MLTRRKKQFAGAAFFLAIALALWGCVGTINSSLSTKGSVPGFATQPSSQTVTVGQTAVFSVTATGTGPFTYQWQKNNSNISGATSSSLHDARNRFRRQWRLVSRGRHQLGRHSDE